MALEKARIRTPDWMRSRDYRIAHRKRPDERWWTIVDTLVAPGPRHTEVFTFIPCEPFRWAGFDIDPASPFVVEAIKVGGELVPMAYPFNAALLTPTKRRHVQTILPDTSITLQLRNTETRAVDLTLRLLSAADLV